MTITADFTINGAAVTGAVSVAAGSTVTAAIIDSTGIAGFVWSFKGTDSPDHAEPTITTSGSPQGSVATFAVPADFGDDLGQSYLLECIASDGRSPATLTVSTAVIGVQNVAGIVPIAANEELERSATHGWTADINKSLASSGAIGAPGPAPALVATSNIALTGIVTVDGVASNTVTGDVLATAQSSTAQNGYWTPGAGAWTRPAYYNSDATVAASLGQAGQAVLSGTLGAGSVWFQSVGTTLAGAKTWNKLATPSLLQDALGTTLPAQTLTQHRGAAILRDPSNGRNSVDHDRVDAREYGANPNGYFSTVASTVSDAVLTLADATLFANGNWAMLHGNGADHGMTTPGAPVVAAQGATGANTISVKVVAVTSTHGFTAAGAATTITNANATLSATNFVECWPNATKVAGAYKYLFFVQFGGIGVYSYVGASIAWPQYDLEGEVYPMSFRLTSSALPAAPPNYPATAPASERVNAHRCKIVGGGGTTSVTVSPAPTTPTNGSFIEIDNTIPLQAAFVADPVGFGREIRIAYGNYYCATDLYLWTPCRVHGTNGGTIQSASVWQFRDGFGFMACNPLTGGQRQPGTQVQVGDRCVPSLRGSGTIGAWLCTAVSGGGPFGITATGGDPAGFAAPTAGDIVTDGTVTWKFRASGNSLLNSLGSAQGYDLSAIGLVSAGKTVPVGRFFCADDLRFCPRNRNGNGDPNNHWTAGATVANGIHILPTLANATGKEYRYSGGVTGGSEPIWPRTNGATIVDGTGTWTCVDYVTQQGAGYLFTTRGYGHGFYVQGFCGSGLVGEGNSFAMGANCNSSHFSYYEIRENTGHHHVMQGGDGELGVFGPAILGLAVPGERKGSCSILDNSNYGNHYQSMLCDGGARYMNQPWLAASQMHYHLDGCYVEGSAGGDTALFGNGLATGGNHANGFTADSTGVRNAVPGLAGPAIPIDSPRLISNNSGSYTQIYLQDGFDRRQNGSGSVAAGTMLDEQYGGFSFDGETIVSLLGRLATIKRTGHYGARDFGEGFPIGLLVGSTFASRARIQAVSAVPTLGLFNPGDYYHWVTDNRRLGIVPSRAGGLGSLGAWAASHAYVRGNIVTQSGKLFEFQLPAATSGSGTAPAGFATAAVGDYVFEASGGGFWRCWGTAQDPLMRAVPNWSAAPASVTDADHTGGSGLTLASGPVFTQTSPSANRAIDLLATGAIAGDGIEYRHSSSVSFTITINNGSGGSAIAVIPANAPCRIRFQFDGANWTVESVATLAPVPAPNPIRTFAGTTDAPTFADQASDVDSTGASAVTVTLNTLPKGTCITYSGSGAGLLSFANGTATLETALPSSGATTAQHQTRTLFWRTATNVRIT